MQVPAFMIGRGATRSDWYLDVSLAAIGLILFHIPFMVVMSIFVWTEPDSVNCLVAGITGALTFTTIVLRRHYPPLFSILVFILIIIQVVVLPYPTISAMVIATSTYDMARWMNIVQARVGLAVWLLVTGFALVEWFLVRGVHAETITTVILLAAVSVVGMILTAYSIGRRGHDLSDAHAMQEKAEREAGRSLLAEQAAQQKSAELATRTGIARELHDIVAHSIAVMVVQAEGGLSMADKDPTRPKEALQTISDTGREALSEMRKIVRTLRFEADAPIVLGTTPSLASLPSLVENAKATLQVTGQPHSLTPTLESVIYRVIQESLTNALKHAGADSDPKVSMWWTDKELTITVVNRHTGRVVSSDNRGTGLIGMAERVQSYNGTLAYGPLESGGFHVCAQLPLQN